MAMLKKITIKGYRSIKDAALELHKLNVLIGANGAGKSNFVSFFKLLNEIIRACQDHGFRRFSLKAMTKAEGN